jgi:Fe2+ transport system protein FeoA
LTIVKRAIQGMMKSSNRSLAMESGCCGGKGDGFVSMGCSAKAAPEASQAPGASVPTATGVCLTTLQAGQMATVFQTSLDPADAALLRAMGLRPAARIRVCRLGEPCIVEVMSGSDSCNRPGGCACRIGLARPLAERVLVTVG